MLMKPNIVKWTRQLCLVGFLCLFFTSLAFGQILDFNFQQITQAEGLTENEFNWYISTDSRRLIWISSDDGLYRYDGQEIRQFNSGNEKALFDDRIQSAFFEDARGDVWFSTIGAINCYKRLQDNFEFFQLAYLTDTIANRYRVFYLDRNNERLWLKADSLIFWFQTDMEKGQSVYQTISDSVSFGIHFAVDTLPSGEVHQIYSFPWSKPGIEIFSLQSDSTWKVERLLNQPISQYTPTLPYVLNGVLQNDESLWLCTKLGLLLFDRIEKKVMGVYAPKGESGQTFKKGIFLDERHLLLTSSGKGLWLFDTYDAVFLGNWPQLVDSDALYLDPQKRLWLSQRGIGVSHASVNSLESQFRNPFQENNTSEKEINFIIEDDSKKIWTVSSLEGIEVFLQELKKTEVYSFDIEDIQIERLNDFSIDESGVLWCVSDTAIYFYKDLSWKLAFHQNIPVFLQLFHTGTSRKLIISSHGIYDLTNNENEFDLVKSEELFFNKAEYSFTRLFKGLGNTILIPFKDKELWIGEVSDKGRIEIVKEIPLLASIYGVSKDEKKQNIWLGTTEGLAKLDVEGKLSWPLQDEQEMGTSSVFGVLEADNGTLFLSTKKGLWAYNPNAEKNKLYRFRLEDGLASESFSHYAALKASDGKMWFGHKKGLMVFHPDSIQPYQYAPNPYISQLLVNNAPLKKDTVVGEAKRIALNHRENTLAFQMKAIGYHLAHLNTLKYKLHDYDDDWVTIKNGESARFTKVPPGEYTLEYKALNVNGLESESKFLTVFIDAPLYKKTWFQALIIFIVGALAYGYYRYRINQIRKEARYKQLIAETETAVLRLQMNPHFIFNSMNSINSYILQKNVDTASDYLHRFARLMRMILKFAAKPFIAISDEIDLLELYLQTEAMRFERKFDYSFDLKDDLDPDEFVIPTMILQPFVENAIWHGISNKKNGEGKIKVSFWQENESLLCSVEDNGVGRAASHKASQKAKSHESKALSITEHRLQLIEQKNGVSASFEIQDLRDAAQNPAGTKVVLRFPLL